MKNKGWISIDRKLQTHWLWNEKREFSKLEAWLDILLTVNHSEQKTIIKNTLFIIKRGESIKSLDTWSKRWNWNKSKVRRFLKTLESDSMIVTKNEHKTTRLTVCKYDSYQDKRNADETQMKQERNASETQMTPNNNDNNINNDNNDDGVYFDITKLRNNYLNDERTLNAVIKNGLKGKTKDEIETLTENFNKHLESNSVHSKTKQDYASHFLYWAKKQKSIKGNKNALKLN